MPTAATDFKTHENKMRRYAERQGYMLVKSKRRDPRARGFGTYMLVQDDRNSVWDPRDPVQMEEAQLKMDRGQGLTITDVEKALHYGEE